MIQYRENSAADGANTVFHDKILRILLMGSGLLTMALALPGLCSASPETFFSRPDTAGYLAPAQALAAGKWFGGYLERAPGFPVLLAGIYRHALLAETVFALIGVLSAVPVYLAAKRYGGRKAALWAAALFSFHPTVLANRPLWLSDTLFGFFAAWQMYFLLEFLAEKRMRDGFAAVTVAAFGALVRPINVAWIFPALFILAVLPGISVRKKCLAAIAGLLLFAAILFPWEYRNARLGAGYCIDTNTGAMYHQNGAMILAAVHQSSFEEEKARILKNLENEFADTARYPDVRSKTSYRLARFRELIFAHPGIWIRQHFRPHVLIPDAATLCENLGLTQSGRGTLDVMHRKGVPAAVMHYFDGRWYIPLLLFPFLIPVLLLTAGVFRELWELLKQYRTSYPWLLAVLACAEYYFFLPGPITVPRYQIPALPVLCVLAGAGLLRNSIGLFGMLAALGILALPVLRLAMRCLLYKAAAAMLSTAAGGRIGKLMGAIGTAYGMVLGLVGTEAVILFLSVYSLLRTVSG